jgi:hypothetical protein
MPENIDVEGMLNYRTFGNELELILVETPDEKIAQWAGSAGAENFEIVPMNLEDQFIEFTEPKRRNKLFQWETN